MSLVMKQGGGLYHLNQDLAKDNGYGYFAQILNPTEALPVVEVVELSSVINNSVNNSTYFAKYAHATEYTENNVATRYSICRKHGSSLPCYKCHTLKYGGWCRRVSGLRLEMERQNLDKNVV